MKKFCILGFIILLITGSTFSIDLGKYFSKRKILIIDTYLNKYFNSLNKLPQEQKCKKLSTTESKINKALKQFNNPRIIALLEYLQIKVAVNLKQCYQKTTPIIPTKNKTQQQSNEKIFINFNVLKRNNILTLFSGAYAVLGLNIKPLYATGWLKSLIVKNIYGNQTDSLIQKAYLISITGQILSTTNFANGIAYFELSKLYRLTKNFNNSIYVAIKLNSIPINQSNKPLKLELLQNYNTFRTLITDVYNNQPMKFISTNTFNSHTYLIRKSKILLSALYNRKRFKPGTYKIYDLSIGTTGGVSKILKIKLNLYANKGILKNTDFQLKINGQNYKNAILNYTGTIYQGILTILFPNTFDINKNTKFEIYNTFNRVPDNTTLSTKLNQISNFTGYVSGNYTGDYSILRSDNNQKNIPTLDNKSWYTESYLDFSKVYEQILKRY